MTVHVYDIEYISYRQSLYRIRIIVAADHIVPAPVCIIPQHQHQYQSLYTTLVTLSPTAQQLQHYLSGWGLSISMALVPISDVKTSGRAARVRMFTRATVPVSKNRGTVSTNTRCPELPENNYS